MKAIFEMRVVVINTNFILIWFVLFVCIIIPAINSRNLNILRNSRKKKGEKRMLPAQLLKEFIGKVCTITLLNSSFGVCGRIEAAEENWIKVDEKGKIRLLNGDMITDIKIMPEKYQK